MINFELEQMPLPYRQRIYVTDAALQIIQNSVDANHAQPEKATHAPINLGVLAAKNERQASQYFAAANHGEAQTQVQEGDAALDAQLDEQEIRAYIDQLTKDIDQTENPLQGVIQ